MDGKRVSGSQDGGHRRKRKRRPAGLQVKERAGRWHIIGTVHVNGRAYRVRRSSGLPATDDTFEEALAEARTAEADIRHEAREGVRANIHVAVAAKRYLTRPRERPLGKTTIEHVQELTKRFGLRRIRDIAPHEWTEWVDDRQDGNSPETRERFISSILAFLNWCAARPQAWLTEVPAFDRDKAARNPRKRAKRRVEDLTFELIAHLADHAAPHLKGQLAALWSTGARGASIIHGCRLSDLILAPGREQITFHNTKNGETVTAALHPWAVGQLEQYLAWRGRLHDRDGPLFLDHARAPYRDIGGRWGTQMRAAWNGMKRRAARAIRAQALDQAARLKRAGRRDQALETLLAARDQARLVAKITPHWFRHRLAREMNRKGDLKSTMAQVGWLDVRTAMAYDEDVPDHRRDIVNSLDGGTSETHRQSKRRQSSLKTSG